MVQGPGHRADHDLPAHAETMTEAAQLQALLLDVDGTLADTEGDGHLPAFNAAFRAHGLPLQWTARHYRQLLAEAPGGRERIHRALQGCGAALGDEPLEALAARVHATKTRYYGERLRRGGIQARPGVARLIAQAHEAGVRTGIVTTAAREGVDALLEAVLPAAAGAIEPIVAGEDVAAKKPAPDGYTQALRRLGCPAGRCIAVEDSANGLAAARAAGLPTLVTVNEWTRGEPFPGALAVLEHLNDRGDGEPVTVDWLARLLAG